MQLTTRAADANETEINGPLQRRMAATSVTMMNNYEDADNDDDDADAGDDDDDIDVDVDDGDDCDGCDDGDGGDAGYDGVFGSRS